MNMQLNIKYNILSDSLSLLSIEFVKITVFYRYLYQ